MDVITLSSDSSSPPSPDCKQKAAADVNFTEDSWDPATELEPLPPWLHAIGEKKFSHKFSSSDELDEDNDNDNLIFQKNKYSEEIYTSQREEYDTEFGIETCKTNFQLDIEETASVVSVNSTPPKRNKIRKNTTKAAEIKQAKAQKKVDLAAQRAKRPGECLKLITVVVDQNLMNEEYGEALLCSLQAAELHYNIEEQLTPRTISWMKTVQDFHCDENMKVISSKSLEREKHILTIMHWTEVFDLIQTHTLRKHIQNICLLYSAPNVVLVIYKLSEYIRSQKTGKKHSGTVKKRKCYDISKHDFEKSLTELQLFECCSYRCVETAEDLGTLVAQFTKAIAEKPFKEEKRSRQQESLDWYAAGSSRNTIRVMKNGFGLSQLWKQQICQFNNVGIDVAEAIIAIYPSPKSLIEAYQACKSQKEGEQLLQNLPVRRGAGPLSSVRRIGPELSKKIYTFFTSLDGETSL